MKLLFSSLLTSILISNVAFSQDDAKVDSLVKIGVCVPLSGQYKSVGKNVLQAIELAASESEISLVVQNCQGDDLHVKKAITTLANNPQIISIIGPIGAKRSRIAIAAADRAKIPIFTLSSALLDNQNSKWAYRFRLAPEEQAAMMGTFAVKDLGQKRAAVLWPDTEFGKRATVAFVKAFEAQGGIVTAESGYSPKTTDFTDAMRGLVGQRFYVGNKRGVKKNKRGYAYVKQRRKIDFDTIFIPDFHHRVSRILAFLPLVGIQNGNNNEGKFVHMLGMSSWQGSSMKFASGVATGALYPDIFAGDAAGGKAEEFVRTFETEYDRIPVDLEAEAFDITWLLSSIIKQVRPDKNFRKNLISKLPYRNEWEGVTGSIKFLPNGDPVRSPEIFRFDTDGEVTPAF